MPASATRQPLVPHPARRRVLGKRQTARSGRSQRTTARAGAQRASSPPRSLLFRFLQVALILLVTPLIGWWLVTSLAFPLLFQVFTRPGEVHLVVQPESSESLLIALITERESFSRLYRLPLTEALTLEGADVRVQLSHRLGLSVSELLTEAKPNWLELMRRGQWTELKYYYLIWKLKQQAGVTSVTPAQLSEQAAPLSRVGAPCAIGVMNTSSVAGAAGKVAALLKAQGGAVVRTTSVEAPLSQSIIFLDEAQAEACALSLPLVLATLPGEVSLERKAGIFNHYRAGLVILLSDSTARTIDHYYSSE